MSVVDDLEKKIKDGVISFDKPALKDELLGRNSGTTKVTADLQRLVLHLSGLVSLKLSSIIRNEGHHGSGRAFDVGNETVASTLLPVIAVDAEVEAHRIDEIIFDAKIAGETDRNKWNYDRGAAHAYDAPTLAKHGDHIHFAVLAPEPSPRRIGRAEVAGKKKRKRVKAKAGVAATRKRSKTRTKVRAKSRTTKKRGAVRKRR